MNYLYTNDVITLFTKSLKGEHGNYCLNLLMNLQYEITLILNNKNKTIHSKIFKWNHKIKYIGHLILYVNPPSANRRNIDGQRDVSQCPASKNRWSNSSCYKSTYERRNFNVFGIVVKPM